MKTLIKTSLLLALMTLPNLAQITISKPDAPPVLYRSYENLSEKEEQAYLEKIKNPQIKKELMEIKKIDEKKYFRLLQKTSYMSFPSIYSVGSDSELMFSSEREVDELRSKISELEIYSEVLGVKYSNANQSDKEKISTQLKNTLSEVFDLREKQRKEEVDKLEKKLAELKESVQIRNNNKQQIIDERFRTLTGKGKYLKWD